MENPIQNLKVLLLILIYLTALTAPSNVLGQESENILQINVRDPAGDPINGATVIILKENGGIALEKKADNFGKVIFEDESDNEIRIRIEAADFAIYEEKLLFEPNEKKIVSVTLEIAPILETVDASEERGVLDSSREAVSEEIIDSLPDDPERIKERLKQIYGDLPIAINGVSGRDIPDKTRIRKITIYREMFSAQFEGTSGARIDIETKTGKQKFRWVASARFSDSLFDARNPFALDKPKYFKISRLGPYFSGGISENLSWYSSVKVGINRQGKFVNATVLDDNLNPQKYIDFQSIPENSLFYNGGFDSFPSATTNLGIDISYFAQKSENLGIGGINLNSRGFSEDRSSFHASASFQHSFNSRSFNSIKGGYWKNSSSTTSEFGDSSIVVADSFSDGALGRYQDQNNSYFEIFDDFVYSKDRFRLGFGGMLRGTHRNQYDYISNATYFFEGRFAPELDNSDNPVLDSSGSQNLKMISNLEAYRRTLVFLRRGYSPQDVRSLGGGATRLDIENADANIAANQLEYAAYFQSAFQLNEALAVSAGLRYENQTNIKSNLDFAPRFGVIWSPKAKANTRAIFSLPNVRVGFGWFYSRFSLNNTFEANLSSNSDAARYIIRDNSILDLFPNEPNGLTIAQNNLPQTIFLIDPAIKSPYQKILSVRATKKLSKNLSLDFSFQHTDGNRFDVRRNINSPIEGTFDIDQPGSAVYPLGTSEPQIELFSKGRTKSQKFELRIRPKSLSILSGNLYLATTYTYLRSKDNLVTGGAYSYDSFFRINHLEKSESDGVHMLNTYLEFEFKNDWNILLLPRFSTGNRFNIITGIDSNGDGFYNERPSFDTSSGNNESIHTKYGLLNTNPEAASELIPRNLGKSPSQFTVNLEVVRSINFGKTIDKNKSRFLGRFNISVNNLFNTTNLGTPIGNISSVNFLESVNTSREARNIEITIALRFN